MAALGDVVVGFRKGGDGQLHMGLEMRQNDGSRELISKAVLDQLYVENNGFQPRVDGLFTALMLMNQAFAKHNYEGWSINTYGLVESNFPGDAKAVEMFNAKLNDLNGFINHHKQRKRAASQPNLPREHRGWICKQGGFVKNWKKRYMVLQNCNLHYFETDKLTPSLRPKGSFQVISIEYARDIKNGIAVYGMSSRVFKFYTDDQSSCTAWYEAISSQLSANPNLRHSLSARERSHSNSSSSSQSSTRPASMSAPPPMATPVPREKVAVPVARSVPQQSMPPKPAPTPVKPVPTPAQPTPAKPPVAQPARPAVAHAASTPVMTAKPVLIQEVLVVLSKTTQGALSMSLKTPNGSAYRLIVSAELNTIYAAHPPFKPLVDGLFTAMSRLNSKLALHNYTGWSLNASGQAVSNVVQDTSEVQRFNQALNAVNGYIHAQKHGHLTKAASAGSIPQVTKKDSQEVDAGRVARNVAANVPIGLVASVASVISPQLGQAVQQAAPILQVGQAVLKEQERQEQRNEFIQAQMAQKAQAARAQVAQRAQQTQAAQQRAKNAQQSRPVVHNGIMCDGCRASPIVGMRYQSSKVPNFDMCSRCVQSGRWNATHGPFQILNKPQVQQPAIHPNVKCDGCSMHPIVGPRYLSKRIVGYDFCHKCVSQGTYNASYGPFDILVRPRVLRTHAGIVCDGCHANPIRGKRYTSKKIPNFDLCQKCVKSKTFEKTHGPFKHVHPATRHSAQEKKENGGEPLEVEIKFEYTDERDAQNDNKDDGGDDDYDNEDGMYEDDSDVFAGDSGDFDPNYDQGYDNSGDFQSDNGGYDNYNDVQANTGDYYDDGNYGADYNGNAADFSNDYSDTGNVFSGDMDYGNMEMNYGDVGNFGVADVGTTFDMGGGFGGVGDAFNNFDTSGMASAFSNMDFSGGDTGFSMDFSSMSFDS